MSDADVVQFVTPLPELQTGVAQYSRDLLNSVDDFWSFRVFGEAGSSPRNRISTSSTEWSLFDPAAPTVYQIGNSEFHERASQLSMKYPGITVLHDTVLHHSRFSQYVRQGRSRDYLKEVHELYGEDGYEIAREFLNGRIPANIIEFPLSEPLIEEARAVGVHNKFALNHVQHRFPEAVVRKISMGIPLPVEIEKHVARSILGLAESAFLIVSVSHINSQKRIPVLLRALRRLIERVPETQCIVAGTRAPALGYDRLVTTLGLQHAVKMPGYVLDRVAQLLIAAADVCVNLRFPSNGETSASQLKMLGAGRPVVVSGGPASEELPEDVGLRLPVDRFEEEMLTEILYELYTDSGFRNHAGREARLFIENNHTMQHMAADYRQLVMDVYDVQLSRLPSTQINEEVISASTPKHQLNRRLSSVDRKVKAGVEDLGLGGEESLLHLVAKSMTELELDRLPKESNSGLEETVKCGVEEYFLRLQCVECHASLRYQANQLDCEKCGSVYPVCNQSVMFNLMNN